MSCVCCCRMKYLARKKQAECDQNFDLCFNFLPSNYLKSFLFKFSASDFNRSELMPKVSAQQVIQNLFEFTDSSTVKQFPINMTESDENKY